jgi:hypothetical protein
MKFLFTCHLNKTIIRKNITEASKYTCMIDEKAELFTRIYDEISNEGDIEEKALKEALIETGKFDKYSAENYIQGALRNGQIYERRAGLYARA